MSNVIVLGSEIGNQKILNSSLAKINTHDQCFSF